MPILVCSHRALPQREQPRRNRSLCSTALLGEALITSGEALEAHKEMNKGVRLSNGSLPLYGKPGAALVWLIRYGFDSPGSWSRMDSEAPLLLCSDGWE